MGLGLIPVALQLGKAVYTALNRPKKQNYDETQNALQRAINNNQSDITSKNLYNSLMNSQKSLGATQYQQMRHNVESMGARGELSEGQVAEGLLSGGAKIQENIGRASDEAMSKQIAFNQEAKSRVEQARLNLAQLRDQIRNQYSLDKQEWKNEIAGGVADTFTSGLNALVQSSQDKAIKAVFDGVDFNNLDDNGLNAILLKLMKVKMGG
jgi:hypothetical protein